jgi:hypothetical protein
MIKRLFITVAIAIASCCDPVKNEYKIVEKLIVQDKSRLGLEYYIILENGIDYNVTGTQYVKAKVGDVWLVKECPR